MGVFSQSLSHVQLCNLMACRPLGFSVHGIFQARILEWVAISSSRGSYSPRDQTHVFCVSCISWWILYHWSHLGSPSLIMFLFLGVCSIIQLCASTDCSPQGSSVHGILQARILVWVAISSSRGSSQCRDQSWGLSSWGSCNGRQYSLPLHHLGRPSLIMLCGYYLSVLSVIFRLLQWKLSVMEERIFW